MKSGFNLIELVVSLVISAIVVTGVLAMHRQIFGSGNSVMEKGDWELSAGMALAQVLEIGRRAQSCSRIASGLQCSIDFSSPPLSQPLVNVRIVQNGTNLEYQKETSPGTYTEALTYPDIVDFVVCDDAMMAAPNGCPLEPQAMSDAHEVNVAAAVSPVGASRFFRFSLSQNIASKGESPQLYTLQSSFYVRYPIPAGGTGIVVYQWGS